MDSIITHLFDWQMEFICSGAVEVVRMNKNVPRWEEMFALLSCL
jgi:hypothetical protein